MTMSHKTVDEMVRRRTGVSKLGAAESDALWTRIVEGVDARDREPALPTPKRRFLAPRRLALAGVLAAAAVAVALVGIRGSSDDHETGLAGLASASASEVLDLTADSASNQASLVPDPGQELYSRVTTWTDQAHLGEPIPEGIPPIQHDSIEEWIRPDGRGVRVDGYSSGSMDWNGKVTRSDPNATRFDVGETVDSRVGVGESWRSILSLRDLEAIPADPDAALAVLRRAVDRYLGRADLETSHETSVVGADYLVLMNLTSLLMTAPLTGDQRAALYEVIAAAPEWYRSEGSADMKVSNQGLGQAQDGREGILISTEMELTEVEAAMLFVHGRKASFGILLDPEDGRVLETRIVVGDTQAPALWTTSDALKLVRPAKG